VATDAGLIAELRLEDAVIFTGGVSDEALKAHYAAAAVFLMTSEHEGFSVPLVEAMAAKVPIVAVGSTAVPGTVGDAGLVWSERDPALLAGAIDAVVSDRRLREGLVSAGARRYRDEFAGVRIAEALKRALSELLV